MKSSTRYMALASTVFVLGVAVEAGAESRDRVLPTANADRDFQFEVAGKISPRCTVTQTEQPASFGDVLDTRAGGNRSAELTLDLGFNCNSPFRVAMTSQNGGLITQTSGGAHFRNRLVYSAIFAITGGRETAACGSADMVAGASRRDRCVFRFRDQHGAAGPAKVKLAMTADTTPLLAGQYADRLVLKITPLMGGDD